MDSAESIERTSLASLISTCQQEDNLFRQKKPVNPIHCFEIWRRAFKIRDEQACEAVLTLYTRYVRVWIRSYLGKAAIPNLEEDFLVNGTFIRVFRFITPLRFDNFLYLAQLMNYLRACSRGAVLDYLRRFEKNYRTEVSNENEQNKSIEDEPDKTSASMEEVAIDQLDFRAFWEAVKKRLNEVEQLAVYTRFVENVPPREIVQSYPHFFSNVNEVHRVLRNALWKLKHNPDLVKWFKDLEN